MVADGSTGLMSMIYIYLLYPPVGYYLLSTIIGYLLSTSIYYPPVGLFYDPAPKSTPNVPAQGAHKRLNVGGVPLRALGVMVIHEGGVPGNHPKNR